MNGIQVLLISGVALIFIYYIFQLRSAFIDLLALVVFAVCAIFFIVFPEYTNDVAARLGVGRGADLLFYVCILLFLFVILKLFARIRRLENMITGLVRQQAKEKATYLGDTN